MDFTIEMTTLLNYSPDELTIRAGDTVEWRNASIMGHTVTADPDLAEDASNVALPQGAQPFKSGNIEPGDVYRRTFDVAGEYIYFCIPHEEQGMVAKLTVLPADAQ